MKVIEREWKLGKYMTYDEIEDIFIPTIKGTRVLPAPFFYDKKVYYELWKRYEPGEKKTFPDGGYEVVDISGGIRSYNLDQVIIHPEVLRHKKMLDKMARRAEKEERKRERYGNKRIKEIREKHGRRGRPALDPAEKERRDALKISSGERSGGRRGRPKSLVLKEPKVTGVGKRGRPKLSADAVAAKEAAKAAQTQRSGGKRGRPKRAK